MKRLILAAVATAALVSPAAAFTVPVDFPTMTWPTATQPAPETTTQSCVDPAQLSQPLDTCAPTSK